MIIEPFVAGGVRFGPLRATPEKAKGVQRSSPSRGTWHESALDGHRIGRQSETGGSNTGWPIRLILVDHETVGWTRFMQKVVERFVLKLFQCGTDGVFIAHLLVYRLLSVTHGGVYPAAWRRDSVLYLGWSPSLLLILAYGRGSFQRRINDPPSLLDVVLSGEQGSISHHRVTQHPFIGIHIVWDRRSASRNFRGNTHRLIARNREVQTESNRIVGTDSEP